MSNNLSDEEKRIASKKTAKSPLNRVLMYGLIFSEILGYN